MTIAFDFGTCNSVVARWNPAANAVEVPMIPNLTRRYSYRLPGEANEHQALVIPSLIHYGAGDHYKLGAQVETAGLVDDYGTFSWIKLDMLKNSSKSRNINGRRISQPMAATDLVSRILTFALGRFGDTEEDLAITVPVESFDSYVDWLMAAVTKVFPRRIRVLDEATACILGYRDQVKDGEIFMVFDFGGGTLDVAIVSIDPNANHEKPCKVLGRAGEEIGGTKVNCWMLEELKTTEDLSEQDIDDVGAALLRDIEEAKVAISSGEPQVDITRINDITGRLINHTFSRQGLIGLLEEKGLFRTVSRTVDRALEQAHDKYATKKSQIAGVFMVGGTSLLQGVKERVEALFPDCDVRCDNPFEAIARGACRYVGGDISSVLVHDYCLKSWNRQNKVFELIPVVPKGTSYPTVGVICGKYICGACDEARELGLVIWERSNMKAPGSTIELGPDGRPVIRVNHQERERALNPADAFIYADPLWSRDEPCRFVVGFAVDDHKRLAISIKDTRQGNRSYIKMKNGEQIYLPVRNLPIVRL